MLFLNQRGAGVFVVRFMLCSSGVTLLVVLRVATVSSTYVLVLCAVAPKETRALRVGCMSRCDCRACVRYWVTRACSSDVEGTKEAGTPRWRG